MVNTPLFIHHETIDSTNTYLKHLPTTDPFKIIVCTANTQTEGRGRLGRTWYSPPDDNIYCSIKYPSSLFSIKKTDGLSLFISLCITETLCALFPTLLFKIKWPNDIVFEDKKISGTLIETTSTHDLIIGFGININGTTSSDYHVHRYPWTSLYEITGKKQHKKNICDQVINTLLEHLPLFFQQGLCPWISAWNQKDYLIGKQIQVKQQNQLITGRAAGISECGALYVDCAEKRHLIYSGDASIIDWN